MKYWCGYLVAAVIAAISYGLMMLGSQFGTLVDMIYPYVMRTGQNMLAQWSSGADFLLWQVLILAGVLVILATLVLMILLKWNPIQWFGWVLASVSLVFMLNTLTYGLNHYAGPLAEDIRLDVVEYNLEELTEAAVCFRDQANIYAERVKRDENGNVDFADFDTLAAKAGEGFQTLVYDRSFPVFAGSTLPVKKLGWADWFTKRGITGVTVGLTGEAAVNPQIPDVALPFAMAHEMAHRMCIAGERDGNFAAYLACVHSGDDEFRYSAFFMAYKLCYEALASMEGQQAAAAAARVQKGVNEKLYQDMVTYDNFFAPISSGNAGNEVCDLLVSWYIQEVVIPSITVEEEKFDPMDETQVDLSGIVNAKIPEEEAVG